jgi:hypothetical protein
VVAHRTMADREFRAAQVTAQILRIRTASSAPQLDTVTAPNGGDLRAESGLGGRDRDYGRPRRGWLRKVGLAGGSDA